MLYVQICMDAGELLCKERSRSVSRCLGNTAKGQQLRMHKWHHDLQIRTSWEIREE
jgi:hypothetical protein